MAMMHFDEERWRKRREDRLRKKAETEKAVADALSAVNRKGNLAAVVLAANRKRAEAMAAKALPKPPDPLKRRKAALKASRKRWAGYKGKKAAREARKAAEARAERKRAKERAAESRERTERQARPYVKRSRFPPDTQLILGQMYPGKVYSIIDIAKWLPHALAGQNFNGYGRSGARVFWRLYNLVLVGILERERIDGKDPATDFYWLSSEGAKYAEICRRWHDWRFSSSPTLVEWHRDRGPDAMLDFFLRAARPFTATERQCSWYVPNGRRPTQGRPSWFLGDGC